MLYVLIDQNNTILYGPDVLSTSWLNSDGSVIDLTTLTADQLIALGWMMWVEVNNNYNPLGQYLPPPTLTFSNNTVTATYTPAYIDTLSIINNVCNAIDSERDTILSNGFYWTDGNLYDCNQTARLNIAGAVVAALATNLQFPPGYSWRTKNNTNVPFTATQVVALGLSVLQYYVGVLGTSWYHKDNIIAMTDPATILAYDFTVGWPSNTLAPVTTTPAPTTTPPPTTGS